MANKSELEQERIDKWIEEHDGEDYCRYCILNDECPHGMACYGGPPIEPPCCNGLENLLYTESILEDLENGKE